MSRAVRRLTASATIALALLLAAFPARPVHAQAQPAPAVCRIGVNVEDHYDLDMARDTFGAILWIWSVCPSPDFAPLGTIAFPTASASLSLSPIETVDLASGGQYASRRVQGTFRYNWDMTQYPFDRQHVVIAMDEAQYGADRLVFEPDDAESFVSPDLRDRLDEWTLSELKLAASVSEEASTYGLPDAHGARYARLEAAIDLKRDHLVTFLKLTSGVFAGVFIAFLSFFYDPNDRSGFGGKLGLLVGVLFAVLLNLRTADSTIGDSGHLTLVTRIHLVTLAFIVILALVALRDRRRVERGLPVRHPDWPMLAATGGIYVAAIAGITLAAAWR
jgi:hypothetical protein